MAPPKHPKVYDGDGDQLMARELSDVADRVILVPGQAPSRQPDAKPRIRIMWGNHLLEDVQAGRYRSIVCAVNAHDNSRGIISQLATLLKTSQWDERSITEYAARFSSGPDKVKVLKYDMDIVEVLAILRPPSRQHLTVDDLRHAFAVVAEMIGRKPGRFPSASVSFLDARANALVDHTGQQPSFETVLRTMYEAGYYGDVYPPTSMWRVAPISVFARYPFPQSLDVMRSGGF
ncbi:MAG: hypothetical protein NZ561_02785 [Phycisphaerae bacterium]|nr:hypothetical protein [Phycisphaerae bacterium]MDW8263310.1 hypothetical protein [Phycisphaerales bacterium]